MLEINREMQRLQAIKDLRAAYMRAGLIAAHEADDLKLPAEQYLAGNREPLREIKAEFDRKVEENKDHIAPRAERHALNVQRAIAKFMEFADQE